MTSSTKSGSFLEESVFFPEDFPQFLLKETDVTQRHASFINQRELGFYYLEEIQTGAKAYNPLSKKISPVFRKMYDFGQLPNSTAKEVSHGISLASTAFFLKIYGVAYNPSDKKFFQFSYPILFTTESKIMVTTSSDLSSYTSSMIVLEYTRA